MSGKLAKRVKNLSLPVFTGTNFSKTISELSSLFKQQLNKGVHGLYFSPYVDM